MDVETQTWQLLRAGQVSIEEISEACFRKSLIMRTRPRLSDEVAKCVGKREARGLHAIDRIMRTRPRLSDEVAKKIIGEICAKTTFHKADYRY